MADAPGQAAPHAQPATGWARIGLTVLTGVAFLGAMASLAAIPLGVVMFLFDDTGVPLGQVAIHALLAAAPLPLFGAIAAGSLWGCLRSARQGAVVAGVAAVVLALMLIAIPDSRDGLAFGYGILVRH